LSAWCETCRYQCLEVIFSSSSMRSSSSSSCSSSSGTIGLQWPLVILSDCVSKKYCVLLPSLCADISQFHGRINQVPSLHPLLLTFTTKHHFTNTVPHISADLLIHGLINSPLPSVSSDIKSFNTSCALCVQNSSIC